MPQPKSLVAVVMGSKSDWETMRHTVETLDELGLPNESRVLSAHRTPDATAEFARSAVDRGLRVIIAGAGNDSVTYHGTESSIDGGTGSNTLVVKDVFVPRHRFLSYKAMNDGTAGGYQTNTAPVYKMPWGTMHPTTISAPIVGMAYGAYDAHVEHQGKRVRAAFAGEKAKDDPFAKVRIAEAASDIDAAWRQLIGNVGDEYALLAAGKEIPFDLRARARRDQVRATGRAISSVDRLFEASGATALANDAPVQRFWRDAHAGRVHAANDPERAYVIFGNHEFGLPPGDTMV